MKAFSKLSVIRLIAGGAFSALALSSGQANAATHQYFVFGTGSGFQTFQTPCPDITCNAGAVCSCVYSTGTFQSTALSGAPGAVLTYKLEVSADNGSHFGNGSGGGCYGTTGLMTMTAPDGAALDINFAGPGCRISPRNSTDLIFGITAPGTITNGTGRFATAKGVGSLSFILDATTSTVDGDIVGTYTK